MTRHRQNPFGACGVTRRTFLTETGMGFTGLALGTMLLRDGLLQAAPAGASAAPARLAHLKPRARSVIWIFLCGGVSHVESFDIKPELDKYAGKSIEDTPYKDVLDPAKVEANVLAGNPTHGGRKIIMPLQTGHRAYGRSGLVVGDWFRHVGACADDLAVVRSLWTVHNDHGAQLTFHTGRHPREGAHPTIGSWAAYGLGTVNDNLPQYVVLGSPVGDCCGGSWSFGAGYLGPQYGGVRLNVDPKEPLPFMRPADAAMSREEQEKNFGLLGRLNRLAGIQYPDDKELVARIKAYELAFQMQAAVPEVMELDKEPAHTHQLYGLDRDATRPFGELCLAARRLVERGVQFVQVFHGGGGGGAWDSHSEIRKNHTRLAEAVDQPIAGLLRDLKQRGLFDDTIVVWGTEFGRTPGAQGTGRDHHPQGFSAWLAGAGIRGGVQHGATDELGFHAVEDRHYVTDIHATVLHLLGLDPHRLQYPGQKRLELDYGEPIRAVLG
jgi:hypothetical protein